MEISLTAIVALLGVGGLLFLKSSFRNKITGWLSFKRGEHKAEQEELETKTEVTKKEIVEMQNKVKELEHKSKVTEDVIKQVVKDGNKKVNDVLKEPEMGKLIEEFEKW